MTCRSAISWTPALHRMMTVPVASRPLLPARPAIWMYSPVRHRKRDVAVSVCIAIKGNVVNRRAKRANKKRLEPGSRFLKLVPSCFRMLSNTTVLAGMFTPMAKVSVANSTWRTGNTFHNRKRAAGCSALTWTLRPLSHLDQTAWKKHLCDLLQDGQDPAVVHG